MELQMASGELEIFARDEEKKLREDVVLSKIAELERKDLVRIQQRRNQGSFDFLEVGAIGSTGGLLCVWNPRVFLLQDSCCSRNFIMVAGKVKSDFDGVLVNLYAPNEVVKRRELWDLIVRIKPLFPKPWCIRGDFNEIRCISERVGCSRRSVGMHDFNEFIDNLEGGGATNEDNREWGPKPLRFMNCWVLHSDFLPITEKVWLEGGFEGCASYKLFQKLGRLKKHLKEWNVTVFGNLSSQRRLAEEEFHQLDLLAESGELLVVERSRRAELKELI
ncbi:uncharacterized protein LOC114324015 [Camellia sinensis]|uniref:uncharacterized protein LOC114324015 n=1 Tax=Camellia sinensis TaxID=4442 RepID=UPI0010369164|nr:uncharacterized protein LOC114324015 [Camellia sinensis]